MQSIDIHTESELYLRAVANRAEQNAIYTIYIPTRFNNGTSVPSHILQSFIDAAITRFGGTSAVQVQGYWKDESRLYIDDNLQLSVLAIDTVDSDSWFLALAHSIKTELEQESVLVHKSPHVSTWFV